MGLFSVFKKKSKGGTSTAGIGYGVKSGLNSVGGPSGISVVGSGTSSDPYRSNTKNSNAPHQRVGIPNKEYESGPNRLNTEYGETRALKQGENSSEAALGEYLKFKGIKPTNQLSATAVQDSVPAQKQSQQNEDLGIVGKIAKMGLKPAELGANLIGRIFGGKGYKYQNTADQLAQTTGGKLLGLGTIGAGAVAGGMSILARFAPNMAAAITGDTAVITRTAYVGKNAITTQRAFGVTAAQSEVLAGHLAKMDAFSLKKLISASYGFLKTHKLATAGILGGSSMMTWLASDNVITSANMLARQTAEAVKWDGMSLTDAKTNLDIAQSNLNAATKFININTRLNPLLIPFRKILITNANAGQQSIDLQRRTLGL